eukprot:CAMPEP_0172523626 /NCGR_PEP_ID=MMETSP1066-20121228/293760_1 /TAXON_ID=671091 /ORGANISM="Coscinodiscus wailesii, Strain CCMP2513" /LENGTH=500 /DNA_ID=CAMNT_0013306709 /DNA_START=362 /DNA_END=1864 /DNA_ORIENTATION=+
MVIFVILHRLGLICRFIQRFAEVEISKQLNRARITVASIEVDFVRGHARAKDLVIHTPKRDEWMWDSPLIARIGHLEVNFNLFSCIDELAPLLGYPCKEIYSVTVEDVQVFIEKRRNVFNFHLLDPSLDLPDPTTIVEQHNAPKTRSAPVVESSSTQSRQGMMQRMSSTPINFSPSSSPSATTTKTLPPLPAAPCRAASTTSLIPSHPPGDATAEKKANEIVTSMLGSLSSLGRAATDGGKEGLEKAFMSHKDGVISRLKQLQASSGGAEKASSRSSFSFKNSKNSVEALAKEGMKVMKQVSKAVEKNVNEITLQMDALKKPPPKKEGWVENDTEEYFRCGRIVGRDLRIFTKDIILGGGSGSAAAASGATAVVEYDAPEKNGHNNSIPAGGGSGATANSTSVRSNGTNHRHHRPANATGWSRPILLKLVTISGAELSPPVSARDKHGLPPVGQKIDAIVDIVLTKLVAEMAKTNTGRLFQTAVGEVFAWMELGGSKRGV